MSLCKELVGSANKSDFDYAIGEKRTRISMRRVFCPLRAGKSAMVAFSCSEICWWIRGNEWPVARTTTARKNCGLTVNAMAEKTWKQTMLLCL